MTDFTSSLSWSMENLTNPEGMGVLTDKFTPLLILLGIGVIVAGVVWMKNRS